MQQKNKLIQIVKESNTILDSGVRVFVDMDGVLTDFEKNGEALFGMPPRKFEDKFGAKEFWKVINGVGVMFWEDMLWMKDGKILWNALLPFSPTILTTPSRDISSKIGKERWIKKNLGYNVPFIMKSEKWEEVKNGAKDVLIDDTQKKIDGWNNAGGTGILHVSAIKSLKQLNAVIESL